MRNFLSNLGWRILFAMSMASMMATFTTFKILEIENEWLQNFSDITITMTAATLLTMTIFSLRSFKKKKH